MCVGLGRLRCSRAAIPARPSPPRVCIEIAYNVFEHEVFARAEATELSARMRRMARRRSLVVLAIFTTAMLVAIVAPRLGFGLICGALILHLRPEAPGSRS